MPEENKNLKIEEKPKRSWKDWFGIRIILIIFIINWLIIEGCLRTCQGGDIVIEDFVALGVLGFSSISIPLEGLWLFHLVKKKLKGKRKIILRLFVILVLISRPFSGTLLGEAIVNFSLEGLITI